jgi:hypothetical protein
MDSVDTSDVCGVGHHVPFYDPAHVHHRGMAITMTLQTTGTFPQLTVRPKPAKKPATKGGKRTR